MAGPQAGFSLNELLARHAADLGPEQLQLFLDALVTTVDVVDAVDQGIAFCYQGTDHQAGRSPQVGGHHWSAFELLDTGNDGGVALDQNLRAHAVHFIDVHETVFKHRLDHCASTFGNRVQGDELRLHVGRERRIRCGTQVHSFRPLAMHVQLDPVAAGGDFSTGFFQLVQHSFEDGRISILDLDSATGNGSGHQVGAGFDAVRHHAVSSTVQTLNAINGDGVGAGTGDFAAHGIDEVGQVDHLRFAGGVFQHRAALGQRSSHHDVFGTGHADDIEEEVRTAQAAFRRLGLDIAAFHVDLRAHGFETTDVQVDRTRTNGAATRQRHFGLAKARDQRAKHEDRRAHGFHQLVGCNQGLDAARIDFDAELLVDHRLNAHAAEQLDHGGDVVQVRQGAHRHRAIGQQGGRQNRQGGV